MRNPLVLAGAAGKGGGGQSVQRCGAEAASAGGGRGGGSGNTANFLGARHGRRGAVGDITANVTAHPDGHPGFSLAISKRPWLRGRCPTRGMLPVKKYYAGGALREPEIPRAGDRAVECGMQCPNDIDATKRWSIERK